jgi:hypothetical protein
MHRTIRASAALLLIALARAAQSAEIHACVDNQSGTLRIVEAGAACRKEEHPVTWSDAPPPAALGGSVNPNGTPQETGFTVVHAAGSGLYRVDFPAGTFPGSAGRFLIAAVTPVSPVNNWVNFASSIAPIAADGSGSFSVQFANGETLFQFVVAVAIR